MSVDQDETGTAPEDVLAHWPVTILPADGAPKPGSMAVAEEVPFSLVYNSIPYAVMMGTPQDVEDFAYGFSLTEGIVSEAAAIREVKLGRTSDGLEVRLHIAGRDFERLLQTRRAMTGRTGCGVCGAETVDALLRPMATLPAGKPIRLSAIRRALQAFDEKQTLNGIVHMVHGAALASSSGEVLLVREDVGRHNALDKLIGAGMRSGADFQEGFCLLTSRCSYEMVQKTVIAGIRVVVAISAPTARALRVAETAGQTLVALARTKSQVIFSGGARILADE